MNATKNLSTPAEIDARLAELYYEYQTTDAKRASHLHTVLSMAGAHFYYRGRQRVTDMTPDEAVQKLSADRDKRDLSWGRTNGEALDQLAELARKLSDIAAASDELEAKYTGWSRFFVVTSSNGHIHSSMHCPTCRPTTAYGWLTELSDKSQAEAIEHFGPAAECLCSVCFPDAPVAKDQNLTANQTEALLAGKTPEAKPTSDSCPGSGQQATERSSNRRYGKCPHCGQMMGVSTYGKIRKHKEPK